MQYILTEEEYKNLVPKFKCEKKCDEIDKLQQLPYESNLSYMYKKHDYKEFLL